MLIQSLEEIEDTIKKNGHLEELCISDALKLIRVCKAAKMLHTLTKAPACGKTETKLTAVDELIAAVEDL